ncbi:unnamed protein product [Periconia digitata]|uniref:Uncharacterized protein n=1 Tax=Periconia digitata TaxID=1303443 RepID=A0A9W4XS55_9PLEO|nr:unnamed protein product [Periconia digitata]
MQRQPRGANHNEVSANYYYDYIYYINFEPSTTNFSQTSFKEGYYVGTSSCVQQMPQDIVPAHPTGHFENEISAKKKRIVGVKYKYMIGHPHCLEPIYSLKNSYPSRLLAILYTIKSSSRTTHSRPPNPHAPVQQNSRKPHTQPLLSIKKWPTKTPVSAPISLPFHSGGSVTPHQHHL